MSLPCFTLPQGGKIPAMGMGTFGSDHCTAAQVGEAVLGALRGGYRLVDCASVYQNEDQVGLAIQNAAREGRIGRGELFVMSKVWNDAHRRVAESFHTSLADLGLEYLDAYFLHWPFPNYHAPGCGPDARNPHSRPFSVEEFMDTWRQMEALVQAGKVRYLGMSNMTIAKLEAVLPLCRVKPALIEQEWHPCFQMEELLSYVKAQGIQPVAYCPLGSPRRPERDKAPGDAVDMEDSAVLAAARAHGISPAQVCLKWAYQRGVVSIPFSLNPRHYTANLQALLGPPLSLEEMDAIKQADRNCRLIKGQVFLWEGAAGWQELWDGEGTIPR